MQFLRSIWKILHLTEYFYTGTAHGARNNYQVWWWWRRRWWWWWYQEARVEHCLIGEQSSSLLFEWWWWSKNWKENHQSWSRNLNHHKKVVTIEKKTPHRIVELGGRLIKNIMMKWERKIIVITKGKRKLFKVGLTK